MTRSPANVPDQAPHHQASEGVPFYPMPRAASRPLDPAPALGALQAEGPLVRVRLWDDSTPWLVTRHAEQRALLADPRVSTEPERPGYPDTSASLRESRAKRRSFINMDDPEHARLRRMVTGAFTIRRIEALRPAVQQIVDDLVSDLLAGPKPADLVAAFALPVPTLAISHLLGVPYADHDFFQRCGAVIADRGTPPEETREAQAALLDYLERLAARKLDAPGDDLLSRLAAEQWQTGQLTRQELAATALLLLIAGHETTANMIALGTLALLRHPEQLAALRDCDDPKVIAGAVEELLRYLSVLHAGRRRVALADIEIAGQVIRAGEGLIMPSEIANRDEAVFGCPAALDVHRDAREHMAFGFGVHQCLGQPLARLELQVVCGTLYRRIPTLALAASLDDLRFKHDAIVYGVDELPVTW